MRTVLAGATVDMRHDDREYSGVNTPLDTAEVVDDVGAIRTASGAVRFLTSELGAVWPKINDRVEVKSTESGEWVTRIVVGVREDEFGATLLVTYGEQYD